MTLHTPVLSALQSRDMEKGGLNNYKDFLHFRMGRDENNVAWLLFSRQGESVNTLNRDVLEDLSSVLDDLKNTPPTGLVIRSEKQSGFCAGADIRDFREVKSSDVMIDELSQGKAILDRLEALPYPTIAVVHGHCLGGGFELALACDHRIAVDGAKFGFPEVQLGLHPGLDGSVRLTRLINPIEAMTYMLTGKTAYTRKAKSLGIVHKIVEERHVKACAQDIIKNTPKSGTNSPIEGLIKTGLGRSLTAKKMRSQTEKQAPKSHYPAPYALIDLWEKHGADREKMSKAETRSFANLMFSETAQNLIRVYFLRESLKSAGENKSEFDHLHMIGAGAMGGDIAAWSAIQGLNVSLADIENAAIGEAMKRAKAMTQKRHLNSMQSRDALDRLIPDPQQNGVQKADILIEAGPEVEKIKKQIYASVEPDLKTTAVLATNTSSLPLADIGRSLKKKGRFAGIHFFNPVASLDLVEVVNWKGANKITMDRARGFIGQISKLPVDVKSAPGFLVNRALMPYILEAILMLKDGIKAETIDKAAEEFGMPVGPIELADQVGLDICEHVGDVLRAQLDTPVADIPEFVRQKVKDGQLGKKTGQGFYKWKDGKAQKEEPGTPPSNAQDRLVLPMLNACATCLRKDIVSDTDALDGAMIFATGFAPFRGGPMHYAQSRGYDEIHGGLLKLEKTYGERFKPDPYWQA
jgi:3-hydroxyacyl-CoA dehydrogenase/enoyl-CoA hydratase/3-hydroxybutyryl-CoA epimerase